MPALRSQQWVTKTLVRGNVHLFLCYKFSMFFNTWALRNFNVPSHHLTKLTRTWRLVQYLHCNFGLVFISDPQPDMAWNLFQAAICVQNVGVHVSCSSHVCTQLAAFFIDPRAKWSTTRGWFFRLFCLYIYSFQVVCFIFSLQVVLWIHKWKRSASSAHHYSSLIFLRQVWLTWAKEDF